MDKDFRQKVMDRMIPVEIEPEAKEKYLQRLLLEIGNVVAADVTREDAEQFDNELLQLLVEQMRISSQQVQTDADQNDTKQAYASYALDYLIGLVSKPAAMILDQKALLSDLRQGGILALRDKLYGASFWVDKAVQKTMIPERKKYEAATGVTELTAEIRKRLADYNLPVFLEGAVGGDTTMVALLKKAEFQDYKTMWLPLLNRLLKLHILTGFNHLNEEEDRYFNKLLFVGLQKRFIHRKGEVPSEKLLDGLFDVITDDYNQIAQQLYKFFAASQGVRTLINPL